VTLYRAHPIEIESYRRLAARIDLSSMSPGRRAVVERIIHASADLEYAETVVAPEGTVDVAVRAIRAGCAVITDVEMTRVGITGVDARCYLAEAAADGPLTRSAAAMRLAAQHHPEGAIVVIGCAPTALYEALELVAAELFHPAAIIALPVGFVGAAASKEAARQTGLAVISNVGDKGGSAVAAAACNAIVRLARA
jgi:precorrin isomerase